MWSAWLQVADFDDGTAEFDTEPQAAAAAEDAPLTVVETVEVIASEPAAADTDAGTTVVETVTVQDDDGNTATVHFGARSAMIQCLQPLLSDPSRVACAAGGQ